MAGFARNSAQRMLSLGDSYSIGEGVAINQAWPAQLVSKLCSEGRHMEGAEVLATTGWTTDELLEAAAQYTFKPPYDLVSLLIGVNNQYRGRSLENYAGEFSHLLDLAIDLAGGRPGQVIVVSIPDWGVTPFALEKSVETTTVAADIDRFNTCARELATQSGAHWVDITELSRDAARALLVEDGLHPSAGQYALWVERILPVARRVLDKASREHD